MLRQLNVVILTYVTRPMVWAIGGIYLLVLMISVFYGIRSSQKVLQAAFPDDSGSYESTLRLEGSKAVRDFEQGNFSRRLTKVQIRWYLADSTPPHGEIRITPNGLRSLKDCKHLKSLQIKHEGKLSADEVQAISELQQLTRLSLHRVRLTSHVWRHLSRLSQLKYLDLSGCVIDGEAPQLESMTSLQTLILGTAEHGGIQSRGTSIFGELHRFPNLKTIVLGDYNNSLVQDPKREGFLPIANPLASIDALRAVTSLRTLYVNEHSLGFPGFEDLQAKLTGVTVRPAFVDVRRMSWILNIVFLNAAVLGLIALQLRSHFAHPGAHLIPAYTWPHLVPPFFLWIGSIVNILPILASGVPIIPAIGVHAACWASMTGIVVVSALLQLIARLPRWISTPLSAVAGAVLGGWIPLMILAVFRFPSSVDWYLRGNEPRVEFALIVLGAVLPLIVIYRSRRLYSVYLENGCDSPVLGLDLASMKSLQQRANRRNDMSPQARWPQWMLGPNLETVIAKSSGGGWRERCRLWIAGNAFSGRVVPLLMGFSALIFVPAQVVQSGFTDYQSDLRPLMLISVLIPDFGMIFFLKQWWIRRSLFGMELLRPNSRQEYIRQMMGAIAWDLVPQGCVYLSLFAMLVSLADSTRMSVGWVIAMLLVAVSRWVLVYGIILWLLLIRRDWMVFLTAILAVYAILFVNVGMLMLQASILGVQNLPSDLPEFGAGLVAVIAVAIGLIGATVAAAAYRRWQTVELA